MLIPSALLPYPEIIGILTDILTGARSILRERLAGAYLYGSLALGAFRPDQSDIDLLIVTDGPVKAKELAALEALHRRVAAGPSPWATELECSYIPKDDLRRHAPARARHPHLDRGSGVLAVEPHDVDWVIQRRVLRDCGLTLAGPDPKELIDPISPDDLRSALAPSDRPGPLRPDGRRPGRDPGPDPAHRRRRPGPGKRPGTGVSSVCSRLTYTDQGLE